MNNEVHHEVTQSGSGGEARAPDTEKITIDHFELVILSELLKHSYLPISRFVMSNSQTDDVQFVALAPVYIHHKTDSIEMVKSFAERLSAMEAKKLISLDYGDALQGYNYKKHLDSEAFHYFESIVSEGAQKSDFLCDTAEIEYGSISITQFGLVAARKIFKAIE